MDKLQPIHLVAIVALVVFAIAIIGVLSNQRAEIAADEAAATTATERAVYLEQMRQANLDECFANAWQLYSADWDGQCELAGEPADCTLYETQYELVEQRYAEAKALCLARY